MRSLQTAWYRREQGPLSLVVVMAILAPLLLGLLPPLAPTAAVVLEQAIAASRCLSPDGNAPIPSHETHDQCCILCPAGSAPAASLADAAPVPARPASWMPSFFATRFLISILPIQSGFSARGPPVA
jgi:hypothetical protein